MSKFTESKIIILLLFQLSLLCTALALLPCIVIADPHPIFRAKSKKYDLFRGHLSPEESIIPEGEEVTQYTQSGNVPSVEDPQPLFRAKSSKYGLTRQSDEMKDETQMDSVEVDPSPLSRSKSRKYQVFREKRPHQNDQSNEDEELILPQTTETNELKTAGETQGECSTSLDGNATMSSCPDRYFCRIDNYICNNQTYQSELEDDVDTIEGFCQERTLRCPRDFRPQCGCNNQTYANECIGKCKECYGMINSKYCLAIE